MGCPDYLAIGYITKDLLDSGFTVGGTVNYSGLTARNLGRGVGVVTSASPYLDLKEALPGIEVVSVPSSVTNAFQNIIVMAHASSSSGPWPKESPSRQYLRSGTIAPSSN